MRRHNVFFDEGIPNAKKTMEYQAGKSNTRLQGETVQS